MANENKINVTENSKNSGSGKHQFIPRPLIQMPSTFKHQPEPLCLLCNQPKGKPEHQGMGGF